MKNETKLKVMLYLKKGSVRRYTRRTPLKTINFINNKAKAYLNKGFKITIRVTYGYGTDVFGKRILFDNIGTFTNVKDLKWAYKAFVTEYLKGDL